MPDGITLDESVRLVDLDEDGDDDVIKSDEKTYSLHLRDGADWKRVISGKRGDGNPREIPMIARNGTNNGAFFHSRHMWIANEDTDKLPNHVDRRSFAELLADVEPQPLPPDTSLRTIHPRPGFKVELMAAEPLVVDPIAFNWGPDGKFWVVEMGSYPTGDRGGRVRYLEDTDNDGRYDKSTVFLDNLSFPTSVLPWRNGVIIACAPDIFFARDTDGDGRADIREVLFTGFVEGNPQHRVNSLTYGLDNWIYGANGDSGGTIKSIKTGETFDIRGRDFRFNPDTGAFDPQSGQSQFGRNRDDYNNYFGCNNARPMYHFVLPDHYLRRNPHVPPMSPPDANISKNPGPAPVFPISRTLPRFNDPHTANRFTSACSAMVYRDDLFGPHFAGNAFISEPVHNLIHREVMIGSSTTFWSQRADDEENREFLASTDNWFRPTTIQTGPDGALWIADMYRAVIEHPEWIPADLQKKLDLHAGHDKGRIYRVYPIDKTPRSIPRLDQLSIEELVAALDSPGGWQRDTAQRLLVHANDPAAIAPLERLARESERALTRIHAMATLEGMKSLSVDLVAAALMDRSRHVRRQAIRLCEPLLADSPEMIDQLVTLADDPDPHVQLQLALTLGESRSPLPAAALAALLQSPYPAVTTAAMSSLDKANLGGVVMNLSSAIEQGKTVKPEVLTNVLRTARGLQHDSFDDVLRVVTQAHNGMLAAWQFTTVAPILDALPPDHSIRAAALRIAADENAEIKLRVAAVAIIDDLDALSKFLTPQLPPEMVFAAVDALVRLDTHAAGDALLRSWKTLVPSQRSDVAWALLSRPSWTPMLLDAIAAKAVSRKELDAVQRQRLLKHDDPSLRERAERLLRESIKPDRQKVLDAFAPTESLTGDPSRGAALFTKLCATCHQHNNIGRVVGPDLKSLADKSPQALLVAIIDPNRAVEAKFTNYVAELNDGQVLTGILSAETGTSITLLGSDAKPQQILRSQLKILRSQGISLMPENLEAGSAPQDLADLIAFIRS
jgi:putative membrane-bound dehydrogenase-like protein